MNMNDFLKHVREKDTLTENGALVHSSTGDVLADQFGLASNYAGRDIDTVFAEQSLLDSKYGVWALRFVFYLRLITRKVKRYDGTQTESVQVGEGRRDEAYKRFLWYSRYKPQLFYENLSLFCTVGSEKDIYNLMFIAEQKGLRLDWRRMLSEVVLTQGETIFNHDFVKKYLPLHRSAKRRTTAWAKFRSRVAVFIRNLINVSDKEMRKIKVSGKAHEFQQLISKKLYEKLYFNKISSKALMQLINGEKLMSKPEVARNFEKWVSSKRTITNTLYPYEILNESLGKTNWAIKKLKDAQFNYLIERAKTLQGTTNRKIICAVDNSASMYLYIPGTQVMVTDITKSLGVFFANLLEGPFHNWVIKFSQYSQWVELSGTPTEMYTQISWKDCPSNTDFLSVIYSIANVRKSHPGIPESDFPDTLLVVSDMEFDYAGPQTNYERAKDILREYFSEEYCNRFTFIWWNCASRHKHFQQNISEPGGYVISGFDGSVIQLLLKGVDEQKSMSKSIQDILSQEILQEVKY